MRIGFIHFREPHANDCRTSTVEIEHVAEHFRPMTSLPIITNAGFDDGRAGRGVRST
jgi:hypothetical protein